MTVNGFGIVQSLLAVPLGGLGQKLVEEPDRLRALDPLSRAARPEPSLAPARAAGRRSAPPVGCYRRASFAATPRPHCAARAKTWSGGRDHRVCASFSMALYYP
ncbi:MAG: hypothetical protein MZV70_44110 [Desulfobacterales bacterium]|nr:hypothetical protein [Desulfobacterales bacterium]